MHARISPVAFLQSLTISCNLLQANQVAKLLWTFKNSKAFHKHIHTHSCVIAVRVSLFPDLRFHLRPREQSWTALTALYHSCGCYCSAGPFPTAEHMGVVLHAAQQHTVPRPAPANLSTWTAVLHAPQLLALHIL